MARIFIIKALITKQLKSLPEPYQTITTAKNHAGVYVYAENVDKYESTKNVYITL